MSEPTKQCCKCEQVKPLTEFTRDKNNKDGRTYDCKECRSAKYKKWCQDNPDKVIETRRKNWAYRKGYYQRPEQKLKYRKKFIEKKYGITYEQYDKMVDSQRNRCYICNRPETTDGRGHLSVDHNHKTGEVRKLLCSNCNTAIGLLDENIELLDKIKKYLKEHANDSTPNSN